MLGKYTFLQVALFVFGLIFCLIYPLAVVWPSGWAWHEGVPHSSQYYMMIVGIYFTLGVFLIRAAANPAAHGSLIQFTIWSSIVHAAIMAVQSFSDPMHMGHLLGDVPALLLVAAVLGVLTRGAPGKVAAARG
ncbi:DUF6632 domain-containing protein [Allopontixanthobacter sp.]|uniref:DUF6632 domain-containing protein n=1 Tax=Allopontixanthobacter sp. TaxID=2906452 RepID=UPI002ABC2075|nr:DUF6632 domain-containing protein [Allopontixanthobacter sp.]MDZ4306364.1 DUF6632 domain-containing protein [Allopontixanthobacter sp.]